MLDDKNQNYNLSCRNSYQIYRNVFSRLTIISTEAVMEYDETLIREIFPHLELVVIFLRHVLTICGCGNESHWPEKEIMVFTLTGWTDSPSVAMTVSTCPSTLNWAGHTVPNELMSRNLYLLPGVMVNTSSGVFVTKPVLGSWKAVSHSALRLWDFRFSRRLAWR